MDDGPAGQPDLPEFLHASYILWLLLAATFLLYRNVWIHFRVDKVYRRMPLLLGFVLVALFIWFAENIATFTKVWIYPSQASEWHMVPLTKLVAWFLLMMLSFVLVSLVSRPQLLATVDGQRKPG